MIRITLRDNTSGAHFDATLQDFRLFEQPDYNFT